MPENETYPTDDVGKSYDVYPAEPPAKWTLADVLNDPEYILILKPLLPLVEPLLRLTWAEVKIVIENLQKKKWRQVYLKLMPVMNDDERRMLMRQSQTLAYEAAIDQANRIVEGKSLALRTLLGLLPMIAGMAL